MFRKRKQQQLRLKPRPGERKRKLLFCIFNRGSCPGKGEGWGRGGGGKLLFISTTPLTLAGNEFLMRRR
ncbi:GL20640 [Drosophila persimilis]|uniref:GL20640 n=1 Tax=Drosophila persimilis TaxID=7234 RepID=B4H812_DROPE|nr:GL20640 [Drosophila persimilis]